MAEIRSPKSIGKKLGRVTEVKAKYFTLAGDEAIHNGDGLCFFNQESGLVGVRVNRVEGRNIFPKEGTAQLHLSAGAEIFRNYDSHFNRLLGHSVLCRKIVVQMTVVEIAEGLRLQITDEDGIVSKTTIIAEKENAKKVGTIETVALQQLKKSGGTVFSVRDVALEISPELFFPSAVFNDLRRKAFANHLEMRLTSYPTDTKRRMLNAYPWPATEVDHFDNITNRKAEEFYLHHGVKQVDPSILRAKSAKDCALMTTKYCIKAQLGMCQKMKMKRTPLVEPLSLVDNTGNYELGFDCNKCEMTVVGPVHRKDSVDQ